MTISLFPRPVDILKKEIRRMLYSFLSRYLHPVHLLSVSFLAVKRGRTRGCGTDSREMEARASEEFEIVCMCILFTFVSEVYIRKNVFLSDLVDIWTKIQ